MAVSRLPVLAAFAISLAVAAPAGAVSGFGVSSALRPASNLTLAAKTGKDARTHTCQAGQQGKAPAKAALVSTPRNFAVVACEQPPRSEFITPNLKQSDAAALDTLG